MSKLSEMFKSMEGFWHHGPSMAPFHNAVIDVVDKLEAEVTALKEAAVRREQEMSDFIMSLRAPKYIMSEQETKPAGDASAEEQAEPMIGQDAAPSADPVPVVAEPVAAAPAIKPVDLPAQPDPVAAAPVVEESEVVGQTDVEGL